MKKEKGGNIGGVLAIALALVLLTLGLLPAVQAAPHNGRTSHRVVVNYAPDTLTITGTNTLTPELSMYLLAPANPLTLTLATAFAQPGDKLCLVSQVTTATVVADTGATGSGGNRSLATGDVWCALFNGTVWAEESFNDNS